MARTAIGAASSAPWNPLRCDGTSLPPNWLLAAKLLAFAVFPGRVFLGTTGPFLPFLPILDAPLFATWLAPTTAAAFYGALLCLMFNRAVQPACLVIAGCLFLHITGHRLDYSNNTMFVGTFLLLIGLYHPRTGLWPLRVQVAIVYFGASLNKALDPAWWDGRFFDTLMNDVLAIRWYAAASHALSPHVLGAILGMLTIGMEAAIAIAILRIGRAGVLLMAAFQTAMFVSTLGHLSALFLYATIALMPPFVEAASRFNGQSLWRPLAWWVAALSIREFPRFLGYA